VPHAPFDPRDQVIVSSLPAAPGLEPKSGGVVFAIASESYVPPKAPPPPPIALRSQPDSIASARSVPRSEVHIARKDTK
jgi:hypothetical protein